MNRLPLLNDTTLHLRYPEREFSVEYLNPILRIVQDRESRATIRLKNQSVSYKATILGGFSTSEELQGEIEYRKFFLVDWHDDHSLPELLFHKRPQEISREYHKLQKIELGLERVGSYHVAYKDGVTADFTHTGPEAWDFHFSTGFPGSVLKEPDGSHTIRFKGLRLAAEEDGYDSESKFIITRSKYSNNLILILQEDATVHLRLNSTADSG